MRKFSRFFLGVIFGAFLGSTIALLFAPESGNETRDLVIARFQTLKKQFEQAVLEKRTELENEIESLKKI